MAKLLTLTDKQINEVLTKLTPHWIGTLEPENLDKAQEAKSATRNWFFGMVINTKFIELNKASAGFKVGDIVSIADIFEPETAQSVAGLIIYRLKHNGLVKQPTIARGFQ